MMKSILSVTGLIAAATAYTNPTAQTYGALLRPDGDNPLVTGQNFDITWTPKEPSAGQTVSLVFCKGNSNNCQIQPSAIVEGVSAAAGKYSYAVPCTLQEGTKSTDSGYGMLIIVDGTGEFQYSTQFSVVKGASCSNSGSTTTTTTSSSSSTTTSMTSGRPSPDSQSTWIQWSYSTTYNTSTSAAPATSTTKVAYTTASPVAQTSAASAPSASFTTAPRPASTTASISASPIASQFTGAAALPTAFANVVGVMGAAVLAGLAL